MKNYFAAARRSHGACAPPKVMKKPSVQQPLSMEASPSPLSSRPKRTQISDLAALTAATHAAFRRERRTELTNATKFHRKSGERSGGICSSADLSWKCFATERSAVGG